MKRYYSKKSLDYAKTLRKNQSDAELILWSHLRNRGLANIKFRRQVPIGKYIVDFLASDKRLIIELDGSQHLDNINYDNDRTQYLQSLNYKVLRVFNNEIFNNLDNVLEYIFMQCSNL